MTIEQFVADHIDQLGNQIGEIVTLRHGTFGPNGRLVRIATFTDGVLLEANGVTKWLREM